MIYGIGADTVQTARIADSLLRPRFALRVFSEKERALLARLSGTRAAGTAAANFAAKEAFLKAAGTGLGGFALNDISALRRQSGAPYYELTGGALAFCRKHGLTAHLSLTHEGGFASAVAILEHISAEARGL